MAVNRTRERFNRIEQMQKKLAELTRGHEIDLLDLVLKFVLDNIEFDKGEIKDTAGNIARLSGLNALYDRFKSNQGADFLAQFREDLTEVSRMNARYFEQFIAQNKLERLETIALNKELKILGFTGDSNKVKTGSFLASIVQSDNPINQVKAEISRLAASRVNRRTASEILEEVITGDGERLGVLESHQYRLINDQYQRIEAGISKEIADREGYEFFQYTGGEMVTSRQWCKDFDGKILHRSEIKEWEDDKWQGKITRGHYDPYRDRGGYNCRHGWNGLPTDVAKALGKNVDKFIEQ